MGLDGILGTAWSGLDAASRRLAVVSQNVANAGTAGYARESAASQDIATGGTRLGLTTRATDDVLQQGSYHATAEQAALNVQSAALAAIDQVAGAPGDAANLAGRLGAVQDAFTTLGGDPANAAQQQAVLQAARAMANGLNQMSQAVTTQRQAAQDSAVASVGQLNTALQAVGALTDQIRAATASGQQTADLQNMRDAQLSTVAGLVDLTVLRRQNGDVLLASGGAVLPLRPSEGAFALAPATLAPDTPLAAAPKLILNGQPIALSGGALGGALALRDRALPAQQATLDEFAHTMATRFDAQGLRLFTDPSGAVPGSGAPYVQSGYVGFAAIIRVNPAVSAAPNLVRDGTQAVAGSPAGASAFTPGGAAGGTVLINRVLDYALGAEAQAGVAQAPAATSGLGVDGAVSTPGDGQGALSTLATGVVVQQSMAASDASSRLATATTLAATLQTKMSSATGVSVDDELATMVQLQNAYSANARVLTTVKDAWTQLLQVLP